MSGEITRLLGWRKYANILTHVGHLPLRARARTHTHTRAHAHTELMETLDDVHTRTHAPTRARAHTHTWLLKSKGVGFGPCPLASAFRLAARYSPCCFATCSNQLISLHNDCESEWEDFSVPDDCESEWQGKGGLLSGVCA